MFKRGVEYVVKKKVSNSRIRLIKALYARKEQREAAGRKITAIDEKYLFLAKDSLINELAIAMEMDVEQVDQLLAEKMKASQKL